MLGRHRAFDVGESRLVDLQRRYAGEEPHFTHVRMDSVEPHHVSSVPDVGAELQVGLAGLLMEFPAGSSIDVGLAGDASAGGAPT
jgi:hypothetical protein